MNPENQLSQRTQLAQVTLPQWALSICIVFIATYSYACSSADELVIIAVILAGLNSILVIQTIKEAIKYGSVGKLLLTASVVFFFWADALEMAFESPPFAVPARLPILSGQFHVELVQQGYFYVAIFQLMLLTGYSIRPRVVRIYSWFRSRVDSASPHAHFFKYGLAACALLPLLMTYGFNIDVTIDALLASRTGSVEQQDIGLLHYLYLFGMYGAALYLCEALVYRSWEQMLGRVRFFILGSFASLPFVMLWGSRHLWLFVALPACILWIYSLRGKINLGTTIKWGTMILLLLLVAQLQLALRFRGWTEIGALSSEQVLEAGSGQFAALLFAENLVPGIHDYFLEPVEPFFLIHWIPRMFWSNKPIMQSWLYYNDSFRRGGAYNVTPSVIGQFHINWGVIGVLFIGAWLGFLTWVADQALASIDFQQQRAMGTAIGVLFAFIVSSFRFYSPVYFTYTAFGFVAMIFVTTQTARKTRPESRMYAMEQP